MIEINPTDLESVHAAVKKIERTAQDRVKAAIEEALPEVADQLAKAAPEDTGTLKRSFGIKIKKYRGDVFGIAGVRSHYEEDTKKGWKIPHKTIHFVRNPFWDDVMQRLRPWLNKVIQNAIDDVGSELE